MGLKKRKTLIFFVCKIQDFLFWTSFKITLVQVFENSLFRERNCFPFEV